MGQIAREMYVSSTPSRCGAGGRKMMSSPWRDKISLAILELQEKGVIQMLYNRWWKNTGDTCNREDSNKESKASALGVDNIVSVGPALCSAVWYGCERRLCPETVCLVWLKPDEAAWLLLHPSPLF
ncbi:Glutamate receptor ionotropic, kainate 2 [Chionoecetes opilio]|uniref:Glutamate receptor ionotropic, kainate 2 n=1 Tax=Chionoecetes opilio TaxID=41210 RepID=A0A8J4XWQ4_CHIOP|nr:Glutamate receptor ionotropic, kainate 2 [Chionoecetes opilio]